MSDDASGAPTGTTEESKAVSAEAQSKTTEESNATDPKDTAKAAAEPAAKPKRKARKKKSDSDAAPVSQATPPIIRRKKSTAPPAEAGADEKSSEAPKAPAAEEKSESKPKEEKKDSGSSDGAKAADGGKAGGAETAAEESKEDTSPNVKAAARMGPAARLAAEAAEKKTALGEDLVQPTESQEVTVTAADLDAEVQKADAPQRRARKKRAVRTTETVSTADGDEAAKEGDASDAAASTESAEESSASEDKKVKAGGEDQGERKRRRPRERDRDRDREPRGRGRERRDDGRRDRGRKKGRDAEPGVAAVGQTSKGRIYRQDLAPDVAAAKAEETRKAAEEERKRKEKEQRDKITLILHPAPKAAKGRKKKSQERPMTAKEALRAKTKGSKRRKGAKSGGKSEGSSEVAAADVKLKKAWLSADADTAADVLAAAAGAEAALVKAWLDASNASALARAAQLSSLGGKARKAARRALNVLKSRGVEVPKLESAEAADKAGPEEIIAMFIPPDASGATFFSISQRQRGGRYHVVDIVLRSQLGVVHANSAKLAGKHIKGWLSRVEEQYGAKPVQVPIEWARHLIAVGRKTNDESKQLVPLGFDSCSPLLEPVPEAAPNHPLFDLIDEDSSKQDVEKAVGDSEVLHREPEFAGWLPDRGALDELLAKVGERVGPEGVKEPDVVDEAIRAEVAAATDRWFTPERRTGLADSMHDCAISLRARRGDDTARHVVAVARAVREAGLITSPPSEIPFLLHFFQKAVAYLVQQNQGQLRVPVPAQPQ